MAERGLKKVPSRERAVPVGDLIGINAFRVNRTLLKQRFVEGGYQARETAHFLLFTREKVPSTIIAHWFAPEEIDADIGYYFLQELKPLGMLNSVQDFGNLFGVIVFSLCPSNMQHALHLYAANTLQRYHDLLNSSSNGFSQRPMSEFATLYKRVRELVVGETLLDAGCSFGFFSLLMAEYAPSLRQIVGMDIQADSFSVVRAIAGEKNHQNVEFVQADLLDDSFGSHGWFDTVVALHVLEHFTESDMYRVLANLLKVTVRRLVIAVPYESGGPEAAYGHEQLFTPSKLGTIGEWCLNQLQGAGSMWLGECAGGLLVIDEQ